MGVVNFDNMYSVRDNGIVLGSDAETNYYNIHQIKKIPTNHGANERIHVPVMTTSISQLSCVNSIKFTGIIPTDANKSSESLQNNLINATTTTTNTTSSTTLSSLATVQEEAGENKNI